MYVVATIESGGGYAQVHSAHRTCAAAEAAMARHIRAMPAQAIIEARVYEVDGRVRSGERIEVDRIIESGDIFDDHWYD